MGATTAVFDPSEVEELGKFSERWRFDYPHLAKPREHSFGLATATDPQDSGGAAWAATEAASGSGLQPLEVVPPKKSEHIFKAVPFSTVGRSWKVCGRYKWKRAEPIPVLEARASLFAIKHAARNIECFGKRLLVLSDSISAVCALDKGRGRSFKMRRVSQQVAAMCLGANLQVCYRWLPSEWNPADGPSRGSIFPSKPVRFPWRRMIHRFLEIDRVQPNKNTAASRNNKRKTPETGKKKDLEQKRKKRKQQLDRAGSLAEASVSSKCRDTYRDCWDRLMLFSKMRLNQSTPPQTVDQCLEAMLNHMFEEGEDLSMAQYMVAAAVYHLPHLKAPRQMLLPRARQSLQGWRKLDPPKSRLPLPWETVALMIQYAMKNNHIQEALMMAMCFVLYLRPGEVCRLRNKDLVPPLNTKAARSRTWSVVLHPTELEVASKTCEFDETVTFDEKELNYIPVAVSKWRNSRRGPRNNPLFTSTPAQLKTVMEKAAKAENLEAVGPPHPYRLRHGGASRDFALGKRKLKEIQRRGRWKTFSSVRRYEKGGRLNQLLHELPASVLRKCIKAADNLEKTFQCRHWVLAGLWPLPSSSRFFLALAISLEAWPQCVDAMCLCGI